MELRVNLDRIKDDILQLAEIGRDANGSRDLSNGVHRCGHAGQAVAERRISSRPDWMARLDGAPTFRPCFPGTSGDPEFWWDRTSTRFPVRVHWMERLEWLSALECLRCLHGA